MTANHCNTIVKRNYSSGKTLRFQVPCYCKYSSKVLVGSEQQICMDLLNALLLQGFLSMSPNDEFCAEGGFWPEGT